MIKYCVVLLLACCFTLATVLEPQFQRIRAHREDSSAGVLATLMGDSRRLFAHDFFVRADAYFHSGFYPTIFDTPKTGEELDLVEESHDKPKGAKEHEQESSFLGPPKDWIDRFGRHFYPTVHTHLSDGGASGKEGQGTVREILPWLQLSADMDPNNIKTFLTAAYWLRTALNKPDEAERFLRRGLRANPDSFDILLELGRVYLNNKKNPGVAHNIFELAVQKWRRQDAAGNKPDPHSYEDIRVEMVRADEALGDLKQQLADLEELILVAQNKDVLRREIEEMKAKLARAQRQ